MSSIVTATYLYTLGDMSTLGAPRARWAEKTILCGECGELFNTFTFCKVRFCPCCGSELRFAKHAKPPKVREYTVIPARDES